MTPAPNSLIDVILDSKALTLWNSKTGPVFWWTSGLPAPFYLRTEVMIGQQLTDDLLQAISDIVKHGATPAERATALQSAVMAAYAQHPAYRTVIRAMVAHAEKEFPASNFTSISGGERRDWFFSIPFAAEIGRQHIYLFKDKSLFCEPSPKSGDKILHVSDIISKAASYFNLWLPTLQHHGLTCAGTVSVNAHGMAGTKRLEEAGCKAAPINRIDLAFFEASHAKGLISEDTIEEIRLYFTSEKDWVERYVMDNSALLNITGTDKKTLERMQSFFTLDPYALHKKYFGFFGKMMAALASGSG